MADIEHVVQGESAPTEAPPSIGAHYIDTENYGIYIAIGTDNYRNWVRLLDGEPAWLDGVQWVEDGNLDADGDTVTVPAGQRLVEFDMSYDFEQMTLQLAPMGNFDPNYEMLVIVNRPNESTAGTLVIPGPQDRAGFETYVTVIPGTLGESSDTTSAAASWTIPIPVGYSALRIFRRKMRVIVMATMAS